MENICKKVIRPCICCGSDDSSVLFTYTFDFMCKVRKVESKHLNAIGWTPDMSSSIVQCKICGAKYVRDVIPSFEEVKGEMDEDQVFATWNRLSTSKNMIANMSIMRILYRLIFLASKRFSKNGDLAKIKIMDYGAGMGRWCNCARALTLQNVYAYEPFSKYHPNMMKKFNYPNITASRNWDDIYSCGPFHAVICNGAFEHFLHPEEDLERIYNSLHDGGYLYILNPFMNLKKELSRLREAKNIIKKDKISHYHPGHVNYLKPFEFKKFLKKSNFKVLNRSPFFDFVGMSHAPRIVFKNLIRELAIFLKLHNNNVFYAEKIIGRV